MLYAKYYCIFASKFNILGRKMERKFDFQPKLISALKNYSKEKFMADLMAGIIVGIVALPLAIAFGIASGVSPEKGLITAIIGGFIVSFLGGSNVQIGGPTEHLSSLYTVSYRISVSKDLPLQPLSPVSYW
jgi:SulP family sulfate permease